MKLLNILVTSIAVLVVGSMKSNAPFAFAAAPVQKKLVFPSDKSVGIIYESKPGSTAWQENSSRKIAIARGEVKLPASTELHLQINFVGGEDLSWLAKLKPDDFVAIDLRTTPVTDEQLKYVGRMTGTRHLHLNDTDITDTGLLSLSPLTQLRYLGMTKTSVKGAGLKALSPSLNYLDMAYNDLSDSAITNLKQLSDLRVLNLNNTGIGNGALAQIAPLKSLAILDLASNRKINDGGIPYLLALSKLNTLVLSDTRVTSKGLMQLQQMKSLGTIKLGQMRLSPAELKQLQKAMPKVWLRVDEQGAPKVSPELFAPLH